MDISFKIINYTEARNKEEWEQINENPSIRLRPKNQLIKRIFAVLLLIFVLSLFLEPFHIFQIGVVSIIIYLRALYGDRDSTSKKNTQLPQKFQYFGENMSFLVDEIKVTSSIEKHNHLFLYTDIQDFLILTDCVVGKKRG